MRRVNKIMVSLGGNLAPSSGNFQHVSFVEANELQRLIENSLVKSAPRDYEHEIRQLELAMVRKGKEKEKAPETNEVVLLETIPPVPSTYCWMVSWFNPAKKNR